MVIKYQFFEKENLFIQKFIGDFSIEQYSKYTQFVMQSLPKKHIRKILIDFRNLNLSDLPIDFMDTLEKVTEMRKHIQEEEIKRDNVVHVFWVDRPFPTVIAQLFIMKFPDLQYHYCSTTENIQRILKLSEKFTDLEKYVQNLENSF